MPRGKRRLMEKRGVPKHLSQCWLCAILEPCESGIYPNPPGSLSLPVLLAPLLTHSCTHSLTHSCCPTTVFEKFQFHCTSLSFDIRSIQFLQPLLFVSISPRFAPTSNFCICHNQNHIRLIGQSIPTIQQPMSNSDHTSSPTIFKVFSILLSMSRNLPSSFHLYCSHIALLDNTE